MRDLGVFVIAVAFIVFIVAVMMRQWRHNADAERETVLRIMSNLEADNKDLRDRLFQTKAMPPSGVDLTEVYEERKLKDREHKEHSGKKVPAGPIERLVDKWAEKDRKAAETGIDFTEPQHRAN